MAYALLTYRKREHTVWLTLNRPDVGNIIDLELAHELNDACRQINRDDEIRAVVITGAGDAFESPQLNGKRW